jgi:soluble lytic murein transglycosylase
MFHLADVYGRMGKAGTKAKLLEELRQLNSMSFYLGPEVVSSYRRPIIASDGRVALEGENGLLEFLKSAFDKREAAIYGVRAALEPMPDSDGGLEERSPYLKRGRHFLQMGFRDWAEKELNVLEASSAVAPRIWFELGVLYDDYAMHWKSVRAFQRVYYSLVRDTRRSLDGHFWILMYPLPYPASIVENCARYNMPPHLIYAMMREESRFDYNAVSRAGAMGLMQLMPATSEQVAGELGFPDGVHERLFMPEINLTFGIWYASHLLKRAAGDAPMMLSAYNAGFGNAKRWFRPNTSTIRAVESIDYRETRNYVKRIVQSAKIYQTYYFSSEAAGGLP